MQTVQLQCGSCSNMMAISVEHLGAQVQCPHCAAVVQTPPRSSVSPPPGPDPYGAAVQPTPQYQAPAPSIQVPERESIFSEPEPSDDLFGGDNSPKVHMPEPAHVAAHEDHGSVAVAEEEEVHADLHAMRSRLAQERKASNFAPTLLVFLVPYSIFTTAFIAYLLYMWPSINTFDYLTDPGNGKNKPKVVFLPVHDLPITAKSKVALNQTIRVGNMEITPLKISRSGNDDLTLEFRAKNVSTDQSIKPIDYDFFKNDKTPYTFLEKLGKDSEKSRIYGGDLEFTDNRGGELGPNQETIVKLSTANGEATRKVVRGLLAQDGRYQWRLQFRRGVTPHRGSMVSMTAVVGVEFAGNDVKN